MLAKKSPPYFALGLALSFQQAFGLILFPNEAHETGDYSEELFEPRRLNEQISRQKFSAHLLTVLPSASPGRLPPPPYCETVFVR